jgi:tRNA modification GTPase
MSAELPRATVRTARGRGAVAVIDVRGPGTFDALAAVLHGATIRPRHDADRPLLRRLGGPSGEEVVVVVDPAADGRPQAAELHCHGGAAVVAWVLERLRERGVQTAFEGADIASSAGADSPRRRAWALLPGAPTARTAEALLEQASGALEDELAAILARLGPDPRGAAGGLRRLIGRSALGVRLLTGHTVALGGPPNVGKSALFNAIAGYERAIVSPVAGTTRDALRARLAFRGWPVELVDTAGLHEAADGLDGRSVSRSRDVLAGADLVLRVVDRSLPFEATDLPALLPAGRTLLVASKADRPPAWDASGRGARAVSAVSGEGLGELIDAVLDRLGVAPDALRGPLPVLASQVGHLERALAAVEAGDTVAARRLLGELLRVGPAAPPGAGPSGDPPTDRVS